MTAQFNFSHSTYPNSSWIDAVYYNSNAKILGVVANGRNYFYANVPYSTFAESRQGSAGSWYNTEVQGKYTPFALHDAPTPDSPVNYFDVGNLNRTHSQLVQPKAKSINSYRVEYKTSGPAVVHADNFEAALADFKANPLKYVTLEVSGVTNIDS